MVVGAALLRMAEVLEFLGIADESGRLVHWRGPPNWTASRVLQIILRLSEQERREASSGCGARSASIATARATATEDWMNPREKCPLSLKRLLVPAPSDLLVMQPASQLANSVKNGGPTLLMV